MSDNGKDASRLSDRVYETHADAVAAIECTYPGPCERSTHRDDGGGDTFYRMALPQDDGPPVELNIREVDGGWGIALHVPPVPKVAAFIPFPTDALPEPVRSFVEAGAKAIGCDTSFLALPMLSVLAAAIGGTRRLRLKRGWEVPSAIWTAIVGESGTSKTPAFRLVMRATRERQRKTLDLHAVEVKEHEAELSRWELKMSEWKKTRDLDDPPPEKPIEPQAERCLVSDTTVEALAPILLANPRGLFLARDELAGWLGSFDRYAGGKGGADAAHFLSMYTGDAITVDRKTGNPRTIDVPRALLSITGGIQPAILHRALGTEHREDGLAARILLACPPRRPKQWTDADIDPRLEDEIASLVNKLYGMEGAAEAEAGNWQPIDVTLTREAQRVWKTFYNAHGKEQSELNGDLAAAWSKLEECPARLALVIHFTRWAAGDSTLASPDAVDVVSMEAAIRLTTWFKNETRRVYAILSESDEDREQRQLVEWIGRKGGAVTVRQVQQGHRQYRTADDAEAALTELVKAGYGSWHDIPPGPKGGRSSREFRLSTPSTSTQPLETRELRGSVDVDTVDVPETQANGRARVTI